MDELKQLLHEYVISVPGILGIVLSDREGIPIIRCKLDECPDSATKPQFLSTHATAGEQANKLGLGTNETIMAVYKNYQVLHMNHAAIVISVIATADAVLSEVRSTADRLKPLVQDISIAVIDPVV